MAEATESAASVSEPAQGHTDTKRGRKKISKKPATDASALPLPAEATAPAPTTDASAPPRPAEAATPVPITSETKAEAAPAAPAPVASPPPAANITPQAETTALAPTTGAFAPPAAAPPAEIATSPAEATTPPQTTNASADTAPPAPTASASMPPAANTTPSAETATAPTTGTSSPPTAAPKPVASAPPAETATPAPTTRASAPPAAAPPAEIATPAPTRGTSAPAEATTPLPTTSASAPAAAPPAPTASASTPPAAETPPAETSTPAPTLVASAPPEAATPAPPSPPPMSEEEQLRFQLADAVKFLAAAQQNATPSPYHRNRNKDAAERYALSCVESRYLQSEPLASPVRTYDDIASHLSPLSRHKVLRPSPTHPLSAPAELPASPTRHRTLPPLANSGSVRGLSSSALLSASASQGLCLQNSRVANATLAMSTRSRLMPERDEKQEAEVKLVHALEEHALVSHQHALTSAQYSALVAAKTALADEELQHRLAANELRKELRVAQAALIDAEKRILAQHGKLRDLVLRLQRSRLRMTKEEEDLSSQLLALRKELADLQRTSRDDEAQFNAAMDATSARAAELEHQLKFFDADTFVEDIELGDLRDAMQKHSLGIAAAHHALHAGRAFKTFNYSDGGWAPNVAQNETIRPPTTSSVASNPTPAPSKIPPQATSSVALLSGKAQSKRHHAATVSTTEVEAQIVLEMIESGAGASVTEMPPTARFEHALKAYKAAVQGSSKSQATLRKFLAGEF